VIKEESIMAQPLRITYPAAFYHIASRGNVQKNVFKRSEKAWKGIEKTEKNLTLSRMKTPFFHIAWASQWRANSLPLTY